MAAAYVMVFASLIGTYAASIRHERKQRLEELRAEQQRIEFDLRQVKAIADEAQPVVVLENGDTHVIVDLKQKHESIYYGGDDIEKTVHAFSFSDRGNDALRRRAGAARRRDPRRQCNGR